MAQARGIPTLGIVLVLVACLLATTPARPEQADPVEIEFWRSVKETTIPAELEAYLQAYPEGQFAPLARIRLKALKGEKEDYASKKISNPTEDDEESPPGAASAIKAHSPGKDHHETSDDTATTELSTPKEKIIEVTLGVHPSDATKGLLGVEVADAGPGFMDAFDLESAGAALVVSPTQDSAADKHGVKPGHLVVSIDDAPTPDGATLVDLVAKNPPGDTLVLTIIELAPTRDALEDLLGRKAESTPEVAYALAQLMQDDEEAVKWYRKAADNGDASAMNKLGYMYDNAEGVAQDHGEAVQWYRKVAAKGHAPAMFNIGLAYAHGQGVEKDNKQAVEWFGKAADKGHAGALYSLGVMYERGNGVTQDYKQAVEWYRKAAERGYASAMHNLGHMYDMAQGVAHDNKKAVEWYLKAAHQGHDIAMFKLGYAYENGEGVAEDKGAAMEWYRKAADRGDGEAMLGVAYLYDRGEGVAEDDSAAAEWYRKAIQKANVTAKATAKNNLGLLYNNGDGVPRDSKQAARLLLEAYRDGDKHAYWNLEKQSNKVLSRETRREVQRLLKQEGLYSGAIDGALGPATRRALEALLSQKKETVASEPATDDFDLGDIGGLGALD